MDVHHIYSRPLLSSTVIGREYEAMSCSRERIFHWPSIHMIGEAIAFCLPVHVASISLSLSLSLSGGGGGGGGDIHLM